MESPFWKQFPGQSRGIFSYFITALTAYLHPLHPDPVIFGYHA